MGKVTKMVGKIREMNNSDLLDRFKHVVRAQAVREYIAAKEDLALTLEVNLESEEIYKRMVANNKNHENKF